MEVTTLLVLAEILGSGERYLQIVGLFEGTTSGNYKKLGRIPGWSIWCVVYYPEVVLFQGSASVPGAGMAEMAIQGTWSGCGPVKGTGLQA